MSRELDFNEEALALFARLGIDPSAQRSHSYNSMDCLFVEEKRGGRIFVGNQTAAHDLKSLSASNITHVVNCTHGMSAIPNYHPGSLQYFQFQIADWSSIVKADDKSLEKFVDPLWAFIDGALGKGEGVLVHCLAGAHRAGTTGVACLMHYGGIRSVGEAIAAAKKVRPIIDPIGRLPAFLERLQRLEAANAAATPAGGSKASGGGAT